MGSVLCVLANTLHALVLLSVWFASKAQCLVISYMFTLFFLYFFIYVHFECVKLPFIKCLLCIRDCEAFYIH